MSTSSTTDPSAPIALITGANRGIGYAVARQLAEHGVTVIIGSRDAARGDEAAARLRDDGLAAQSVALDVTSESSVAAVALQVDRDHGRLDILVNNAGILPEATTADIERPLDLRMFRQTFETNVLGAVSVTKELLPLLRRSLAGRIVNVSSTMGSLTDQSDPTSPYFGLVVPAYQMSKAALNGLTVALAKALADTPIKVNSVCPGWVQTDLGGAENRAAAPASAGTAAAIVVEMALIPIDGPTGTFVDAAGPVAW